MKTKWIVGLCCLGFVLNMCHAADAAWDAENLVKSKLCMLCHKKDDVGNQTEAWQKSKHAKAFEVLASEKGKEVAKKAGVADPQTSGKCLKCHTTAYGFTEAAVTEDIEPKEGVTCQACHGPGSKYKSKTKHAKDPETAMKELGLVKITSAVCERCHNKNSPTHDPARYKLADGTTAGFDFKQAVEKIKHPVPKK